MLLGLNYYDRPTNNHGPEKYDHEMSELEWSRAERITDKTNVQQGGIHGQRR